MQKHSFSRNLIVLKKQEFFLVQHKINEKVDKGFFALVISRNEVRIIKRIHSPHVRSSEDSGIR